MPGLGHVPGPKEEVQSFGRYQEPMIVGNWMGRREIGPEPGGVYCNVSAQLQGGFLSFRAG